MGVGVFDLPNVVVLVGVGVGPLAAVTMIYCINRLKLRMRLDQAAQRAPGDGRDRRSRWCWDKRMHNTLCPRPAPGEQAVSRQHNVGLGGEDCGGPEEGQSGWWWSGVRSPRPNFCNKRDEGFWWLAEELEIASRRRLVPLVPLVSGVPGKGGELLVCETD